MKLFSHVLYAGFGLAASVLIASQLLAHGGATGVVKERMDYMETLGDSTKAVGAMFKGEAPYDLGIVQEHAAYIAGKAPQLTELFPEGTHHDPSEALPVIWDQWEDFQNLAAEFQTSSSAFLETVDSAAEQNQVRAAFAQVGKTCSNCHEVYREKKE